MEYTIKVTPPSGKTTEQVVDAPNQRDAHLLAARYATGYMKPPAGTETEIVLPEPLAGGTAQF